MGYFVKHYQSNYKNMEKEHKQFLDSLRDGGSVNMFGAAPYLMERFGLDKYEARKILKEWMDTFNE